MKKMKETRQHNEQRPLALIYVRVSTGRQAKTGYSLESQPAILAKVALKDGYRIEIITETGSGRNSSRPALTAALSRLATGQAQALYALDIDRLARSTQHLLEIATASRKQGWRLVVISADVDTNSPAGEMFFTMAAAFAQYESRMISQRVLRQHEARRERGVVWGHTEGPKSPLDPDLIERIIALHSEGVSMNSIAKRFIDEGIPTARGGRWAAATIRGILNSPAVKARQPA
jgi:DNA invertase Pin-like site-specific DNA recombinase